MPIGNMMKAMYSLVPLIALDTSENGAEAEVFVCHFLHHGIKIMTCQVSCNKAVWLGAARRSMRGAFLTATLSQRASCGTSWD